MAALDRIQFALSTQRATEFEPLPARKEAIDSTLAYLSSVQARRSLDSNPYWPKWDSPWWHMAVLNEMGLASQIPKKCTDQMVAVVKQQMLSRFFASEVPAGRDPVMDTYCHCSLGNLVQILSAAGADVDRVLPWAHDWFVRYQLPDGGFNCDEAAYHCPAAASSLVGTIAPLEAVLFYTKREFTEPEAKLLDAGASCLLSRKLMRGCTEPPNAEEQQDEADWRLLAFPRFYFYDVLRGIFFVLNWARVRNKPISAEAIVEVVELLCQKSSDGVLRVERQAFEGVGSRVRLESGVWGKVERASTFELMNEVSVIGADSRYLTQQWRAAKVQLKDLIVAGLVR